MPERDWRFRLDDVLTAASDIAEDIAGIDAVRFAENRRIRHAVERNLAVIGEAIRNIPSNVLATEPNDAWKRAIGMRNILVHGYFALDENILWVTASQDVPVLAAAIERLKQRLGPA